MLARLLPMTLRLIAFALSPDSAVENELSISYLHVVCLIPFLRHGVRRCGGALPGRGSRPSGRGTRVQARERSGQGAGERADRAELVVEALECGADVHQL